MHYGIILYSDISIGTKAFNSELSLRGGYRGGLCRIMIPGIGDRCIITNCPWEPRQNVNLKLISFNPATDKHVDPEHVYVFSDGACVNNGLTIVPGDSPVDTVFSSYIVE